MTALGPDFVKGAVAAASATITEHAEALTALDQAIGDGDHGINMRRGFDALAVESDALSAKPLGEALKSAGMKLVMTVGGASGPLFGTFLMTLGREIVEAPDRPAFAHAFAKAVDAVAARGKSRQGQKTMLDVLYPVSAAISEGRSHAEITATAHAAAEATIPVKATRGRASFLGDRSIGHMDPGARSTALLVETVAAFMESKQ